MLIFQLKRQRPYYFQSRGTPYLVVSSTSRDEQAVTSLTGPLFTKSEISARYVKFKRNGVLDVENKSCYLRLVVRTLGGSGGIRTHAPEETGA